MSESEELNVLLTNDDGIDSPGIGALYESLSSATGVSVTTVAPADDQSAVGRAISRDVGVIDHQMGYAVTGTPADCVVAGLGELTPDVDLVVSGCNKGANLGEYVLGRSGTVSAAVEAAYFEVPAIATSLYVPVSDDRPFYEIETAVEDYREATRVTRFLIDQAVGNGLFEQVGYLNVNVPLPGEDPAPIELTRPSTRYDMRAHWEDATTLAVHDGTWERMDPETIPDPDGTDRRAVAEGNVSVSPLTPPHAVTDVDVLDRLVAEYPSVQQRT